MQTLYLISILNNCLQFSQKTKKTDTHSLQFSQKTEKTDTHGLQFSQKTKKTDTHTKFVPHHMQNVSR